MSLLDKDFDEVASNRIENINDWINEGREVYNNWRANYMFDNDTRDIRYEMKKWFFKYTGGQFPGCGVADIALDNIQPISWNNTTDRFVGVNINDLDKIQLLHATPTERIVVLTAQNITSIEKLMKMRYVTVMDSYDIQDSNYWGNPIGIQTFVQHNQLMTRYWQLSSYEFDYNNETYLIRIPGTIQLFGVSEWPDWLVECDSNGKMKFKCPFDRCCIWLKNCTWKGEWIYDDHLSGGVMDVTTPYSNTLGIYI